MPNKQASGVSCKYNVQVTNSQTVPTKQTAPNQRNTTTMRGRLHPTVVHPTVLLTSSESHNILQKQHERTLSMCGMLLSCPSQVIAESIPSLIRVTHEVEYCVMIHLIHMEHLHPHARMEPASVISRSPPPSFHVPSSKPAGCIHDYICSVRAEFLLLWRLNTRSKMLGLRRAGVFSNHGIEPSREYFLGKQRPAAVSQTGRSEGQQCS
mmetsp:Transcript_18398/g.39556  ORF Transcript_18398/g.39556 Transcript_18398/m.39556 type:complete len:209 (-) Transcript_18398:1255-1881(-)